MTMPGGRSILTMFSVGITSLASTLPSYVFRMASRRREGGECVSVEGTGCVGAAGTVPAVGSSEGACTCWEVASGDGGGGEALRRAALGVGRHARGHASGKAAAGVGGGEVN